MKLEDIKTGVRVKCHYGSTKFKDKIATIDEPHDYNGVIDGWYMVWDGGQDRGWWLLNSIEVYFEVIEDTSTGISSATISNTSTAINDHTCPLCQNNRCSKSEKTCWRCGSPLH